MKMIETLTLEQRKNLFLNNKVVGIFDGLILSSDAFYSLAYPMCLGYYTVRSANKTVAPIYTQLMEFVKDNNVGTDNYIEMTNALLSTNIIRPKFIDKWNRIYSALIVGQYDPLKGFEYSERKECDNSDTTTYNIEVGKTGNNSDSITYNTNTEDNGKTGTKEVTTTNRENSGDIYGFNSASPVGDNVDTENATETIVGSADDNTSHNIQTKTGSDTKNITISETENKTGTDTKNFLISEDVTKSGRNVTGAELLEAELNLRNTQIFFDIVYRDIDSVATIPLYI